MAFIIGALVIDRDKAFPSFWWDRDRRGLWEWDLLFFLRWDCNRGPYSGTGTSSSCAGTATAGPCMTGTSSSSGGATTIMGCDSETSSSPTCVTPNSSSILCNVICKNCNIPKWSHSRQRGLNIFEKKGRTKNLPIGEVGLVCHGGGGGSGLIL
jgi:hypothetical protein